MFSTICSGESARGELGMGLSTPHPCPSPSSQGEGDAMARFVESGERIPRRGEVGLDANEIEAFEDLG